MSAIRNLGWLIIFSIAVFPSGGYAKDELTREKATALLNAELANRPVNALRFAKESNGFEKGLNGFEKGLNGFEQAKKYGLFEEIKVDWRGKKFFFSKFPW